MARDHGPRCNCSECALGDWIAECTRTPMVDHVLVSEEERPITREQLIRAQQLMWCGNGDCRCLSVSPLLTMTGIERAKYWERRKAEEFGRAWRT